MARKPTPNVRFAAAVLMAMIAAVVIAGTATAGESDALLAGSAAAAGKAPPARQIDGLDSQALKRRYLDCERAASDGTLDRASVMSCSVVYEELKQRVFGGSFEALHAWWRHTPDRVAR